MEGSSRNKCLLLILDGVGCGELPDADDFSDAGSNTLGNLGEVIGHLDLPNLEELGLGCIIPIQGVEEVDNPKACFGKMAEISPAKDSTVGHWELMGYPVAKAFPTYPNGFPPEIVRELSEATGRKFIGNKPASGTEIIAELGEEHLKTGALILYTSADSVLQIAAHENKVPVHDLYEYCGIARRIMSGEHGVSRVIARPFVGTPGEFDRTTNRHDFSLPPDRTTVLDLLREADVNVISVGKINDLFCGKGVNASNPTKGNLDGIEKTIQLSKELDSGLIFTNLVDFDMLWGHRNSPEGFYVGLSEFDSHLPLIMKTLNEGDLLIITADHGVDPTTESTDHSREYVPLLAWTPGLKAGKNLGIRKTFADVGETVADFFGIQGTGIGESFLSDVMS